MEQFSLEKWLQDKSRKVVTRDGRPVRIICWDRNTTYWKIIGLITSPDGSTENPFTYDVDGNESDGCLHDHRNDLFFADKEEELTEFERELKMMMVSFSNGNLGSDFIKEMPKSKLHNYAYRLFDLARKELEANYYTKVLDDGMVFKSGLHDMDLQAAYDMGKQDALKDLPKWKKITEAKQNYLAYGYLSHDGYYLSIQELKGKLPKEE